MHRSTRRFTAVVGDRPLELQGTAHKATRYSITSNNSLFSDGPLYRLSFLTMSTYSQSLPDTAHSTEMFRPAQPIKVNESLQIDEPEQSAQSEGPSSMPRSLWLVLAAISGMAASTCARGQSPGSDDVLPAYQASYSLFDTSLSNDESLVTHAGYASCEELCDEPISECQACDSHACGCPSARQHRTAIFADFLYLRAGNADLVYAREQTDSNVLPDAPTGRVGSFPVDHHPSFRFGARWAWDDYRSIEGSFTWFESGASSSISSVGQPGQVALDMTGSYPLTPTSSFGMAAVANGTYNIRFQTVDLDYRRRLWGSVGSDVDYTVGLRYARLTHDFSASFLRILNAGGGWDYVDADIRYDGIGLHLGLDGFSRLPRSGWRLYAKGDISFLAGGWRANFRQTSENGAYAPIGDQFADFPIVTILEGELGVGWESADGRWRILAGYSLSGWLDTVTMRSFIAGVRSGSPSGRNETITFDGLTTRIEWRY